MTVANPFDAIFLKIEELGAAVSRVGKAVSEVARKVAEPVPEWEAIVQAMQRRKKARKTLMAAMMKGKIRYQRIGEGKCAEYYLSISDLDALYPVVAA